MPSIIDDEPQGQWNDSNRAFLQNLMGKGRMSFKEGQIILAEIFDVDAGSATLPVDDTTKLTAYRT